VTRSVSRLVTRFALGLQRGCESACLWLSLQRIYSLYIVTRFALGLQRGCESACLWLSLQRIYSLHIAYSL